MSVTMNTPGIDSLASETAHRRRQTEYAMRAAFLCRQYVPQEEGYLRNSQPMASDYAQGILTWSTPYAAKQYYTPMKHSTAGTTDHWDEACARAPGKNLADYARQQLWED